MTREWAYTKIHGLSGNVHLFITLSSSLATTMQSPPHKPMRQWPFNFGETRTCTHIHTSSRTWFTFSVIIIEMYIPRSRSYMYLLVISGNALDPLNVEVIPRNLWGRP